LSQGWPALIDRGLSPVLWALAFPFSGETPTNTGQASMPHGQSSPVASSHGAIRPKLCQGCVWPLIRR
jgi:hypothetical protein